MTPAQESSLARLLNELSTTSRNYAVARGEYVKTEKYLSIVKHRLMAAMRQQDPKMSVAAAETEATASQEYQEAVDGYAAATEQATQLEWDMRIAQWRVELFRTKEASRRVEMQHLHGVT